MTTAREIDPLPKLTDWKPEVTIVPFSGVQILDFGFALDALAFKPRKFIERTTREEADHAVRALIPLTGDDEKDAPILNAARRDDDEYAIKAEAALEPFLGKWAPAPVFRLRPGRGPGGREQFDAGPSTWARLRVVALGGRDPATGHTHRFQIALDTSLAPEEDEAAYAAPTVKDAADEREFRFVHEAQDMDWFLRRPEERDGDVIDLQKWVSEWLHELFVEFRQAQRPGRPLRPEDMPYRFEHWARYLTLIDLVARTPIPKLRLLDIVSKDERYRPVEVDLVLDVGNSRTCGILIESYPDEARVDLNKSYALEIRDLTRPEIVHSGLLESRVEFAEARFGKDHIARRSGRRAAFVWPSFVRIGAEAMEMVRQEEGTETTSGLSSPKRYLWDTDPVGQDWRFQNVGANASLPLIARSAFRFLNESGDVISQVESEEQRKLRRRGQTSHEPAIRPRFSRSSLYGFMLGEIFAHALVQINDPAGRSRRKQADMPRRLRKIILTLPSATPIQEQAIIRSRAEGALRLIWSILDLQETTAATCARPQLIVDWDEASCTQLVYLYTEITQKFGGRIERYFTLRGRARPRPEGGAPEPSLRLACVDIGGGTTDLMVTTYYGEADRVIHPRQTFREGFRIAGDDLVRDVVSSVVLPRLRESIEAAGGRYVAEQLRLLFQGDSGGLDEQANQLRRQFGIRVLAPLAVAALSRSETIGEADAVTVVAGDALGWAAPARGAEDAPRELAVGRRLIDYVEGPARQCGAEGWRLADFHFTVRRSEIDGSVQNVFQRALSNLVEAIAHLDADVVLLTGRPSRLPAVRALVREALAVSPDRLVSMHDYRVDGWYPFRDRITNRIGDPKSTVAVGAMLCALSASRIANFRFRTDELKMRSTARFIGDMATDGQIRDTNVFLRDLDPDDPAGAQEEAEVKLYALMQIGFRQLPLERWTTTPLYRLELTNAKAEGRPSPLKVLLRRDRAEDEPTDAESFLRAEAMKEAFRVAEVEDAEGAPCKPSDVRLRLHTLGFEDSYWLDTGSFRVV
jgi:hypothetical protein